MSRQLILTHGEMITLENILEKQVRLLESNHYQKNFTVNEILETKQIYKRVVQQNQMPTGGEQKNERIYRG